MRNRVLSKRIPLQLFGAGYEKEVSKGAPIEAFRGIHISFGGSLDLWLL